MVSAVFHDSVALNTPAPPASAGSAKPVLKVIEGADPAKRPNASPEPVVEARVPYDWRELWLKVLPPVMGLALLVGIWALVSITSGSAIPTPAQTLEQAITIFSDPFYSKGPNDQGVGWNVLSSLKRVAMGFGLAAVVGIPAGFMIGRFTFLSRMFNPLISLLRPVSPLAWLPIGLLVFKGANPAAIWTIFICSIWPMIINTAVGVQRVPQDYMNVARVLNLSEWKIIIAIFVIGIVGLLLEMALIKLATAFTFEEVKN